MFSRKILAIAAIFILVVATIVYITVNNSSQAPQIGLNRFVIACFAPFQKAVTKSVGFFGDIWHHYFFLVSVSQENVSLRERLGQEIEKNNRCREIELSNQRLRQLLSFQNTTRRRMVAAEIIGKDPSPFFKTIIIDKGRSEGLRKGQPVVVPEGIVGQVMETANHHSKVLLIIDQNSAVDSLVQRTRARGIIKGDPGGQCRFHYVLRKNEVAIGDTVVSSGLDGVFPKGLRVGHVSSMIKRNSGIFQEISVSSFVDFERIEEVLVMIDPTMDVPVEAAS